MDGEDDNGWKSVTPGDAIELLINDFDEKFAGLDTKASLSEYLRLVQAQSELAEQSEPETVVVRWLDSKCSDTTLNEA